MSRRMLAVFAIVGLTLAVVVAAPVLLSSQDLYRWATDTHGLGLPAEWAWLVPVALDCAAVAMIGMTIVCAARRERPGLFEALVWVFAGVSAYAQYLHGVDSRTGGGAQDAWWAFPAFALLGPVLLHVTLGRLRRWARQDAGEQARGAAGFGVMWLPGVAFRQTLRAWAASRREQIPTVDSAIAYVREVHALRGLSHVDALRYAFGALGPDAGPHAARIWLQARGVMVAQAAVDEAAQAGLNSQPDDRPRPAAEPAHDTKLTTGPGRPEETPAHRPNEPVRKPARGTRAGRPVKPARRAARKPDQAGPAVTLRPGDEEALRQLAETHDSPPGKTAIATTLGVGGSKAGRLAALIKHTGEWPVVPPAQAGAEPARVNGHNMIEQEA